MAIPWTTASVADCLTPVPAAGKTKLQARDYKHAGRFPVVDQGQERIAGWTDDESAVISEPLPLIVFGDHTRTFKFIDQPFARGADGTQLLKPKRGIDPLFFFYACKAIDLPARGYNRHFTILKEQGLSYPGEAEQQAVGSVLRRVDSALEHHTELIGITQALKRAATRDLFTRGLRGEPQKESEIGPIPKSWSISACEGLAQEITVGVVVKPASYYVTTGIPAFRSLNIREDRIDASNLVYFSAQDNATVLSKSKLRTGDVLVVRTGYPGTSCVVPQEFDGANCIDLVVVRPRGDRLIGRFLSRFLNSDQGKSQALANSHGLAQKHLNVGAVRQLKVPVPPIVDEQLEIVTILDAIDRKIDLYQRKRAVLVKLFKALLHKLMTGEIAVDQLDLSALERAPAPDGAHA